MVWRERGEGGGRSSRYGFIAVRGNVGIIRVRVVLRDNGEGRNGLFPWNFFPSLLDFVYN